MMKKWLMAGVVTAALALGANAQTTTTGAISGVVIDPTGAAVSGAKVVVTGKSTGITQTVTTGTNGAFSVPFLKPDLYEVVITANGFETVKETIPASQGTTASADTKLKMGQSSTTIEVGANFQPLLQTEDAQLVTTFNQEQVQTLPNPGGDITYYANTAPGVVMNTGGGYGNFSANGLPGTSNNFTVNGQQENDPFLNLNNSGPTNLLLGQNDISSVSVITSAYGAAFGSFGGAQINEISRSGTNKFHGDASYWWNGRTLNASNWFTGNHFFSNANQWAAGFGGPIIPSKTFFFVDWEGMRFITAPTTFVSVPTVAYQNAVVGNNHACNDATSSLFNGGTGAGPNNECAFYNKMFALFNGAPGIAGATIQPATVVGYFGPGATNPYYDTVDSTASGAPDIRAFYSNPKIFAKESLVTARVDQIIGAKDSAFIHFKYDNGTQPTYVDPINSAFNDVSYQPEYEGQLSETHLFNTNLVNQFLATVAHYGAFFQNVNQSAANAALPFGAVVFGEGYFSSLGGEGYVFPQGRNATQYQFADDVSWTRGKHNLKFGYAWKKDDITNFDNQIYNNPLVVTFEDFQDGFFTGGVEYYERQTFPTRLSQPNALYTEGFYAQDSYKPYNNLLITAGIRFEINSNPACPHSCFSRLNTDLNSFLAQGPGTGTNSTATPYTSVIKYNQQRAFDSYQPVSYEPRLEVIWSPTPKTSVRGGFGLFSDSFPGQVADNLMRNTPGDPRFQAQYDGVTPYGGYYAPLFDPANSLSGTKTVASANATFTSGTPYNFGNGGSYSQLHSENTAIVRPNLSTAAPSVHYPTYEEWSFQVQREINKDTSIQLTYAGNHGYHEPVEAANANGYNPYFGSGAAPTAGVKNFAGVPSTRPASSFGAVTNLSSTAVSKYQGGMASLIHRSGRSQFQFNYTYSHTLDQVSNGGFLGFTGSSITGPLAPNSLKYNYGNADYDVRHSVNGNYLLHVPSLGTGIAKVLTEDFVVGGTVFYRTGFPFTITDSNVSGYLSNYTGGIPALTSTAPSKYTCDGKTAAISTCLTASNYTDPTVFIAGQRNRYHGPHYFNTDMSINRDIHLPFEGLKFSAGAVFYNIFNHPNFGNPTSDIASPYFGKSLGTVSVPTSIYGSGLGGDASPRIIQLHAKVSF